MIRNWYVTFADSKKAEKVTFSEFVTLKNMAKFYNALISDNFCPKGKSMKVSFNKSFV